MDHIPIEVLHEIFINLPLKEKLKCMLVCRFWRDTLDKRTLLHTVFVNTRQYPKFKEMIERQSYRGVQVECLTLTGPSGFNSDKRILCNMLPNLRELIVSINIYGGEITHYLDSPFQFNHSQMRCRIKRI